MHTKEETHDFKKLNLFYGYKMHQLSSVKCLKMISEILKQYITTSDRPIFFFFITDSDYLYVYVPDMQNRYLFTVIK